MPKDIPATAKELRAAQDQFIEIWGRMGSSWGIQRSMAEVHALLFIVGEPLNTDEIMDRLKISRGNASMSVRALLEWGVVSRAHKRGDRKEYFQAEGDVWRMFRRILRERKRREIDPVLAALFDCRDMTKDTKSGDIALHNERLDDLIEFMGIVESLADRFTSPAGQGLRLAAGLLGKKVV